MTLRIQLVDSIPAGIDAGNCVGSNALDLASAPELTLRFSIETSQADELDALRHARRSMLREEWTLGRDGDEPSLEDAVFTPSDICWRIQSEQRLWCLQKVEELTARANRCHADLLSA